MADDPREHERPTRWVQLWVGVVRVYQGTLAAVFGGACRFYPSCSEYSVLAVRRHGLWQGLRLSIWRVLRCQPFSSGGLDFP